MFKLAGAKTSDHILEVGCGSGALLQVMEEDGYSSLTGIDIDFSSIQSPSHDFPIACADGLDLPFPVHTFNHAVCHFTLLWVEDPQRMIGEMQRVIRPGGWVFALAEPDYSARVSHPEPLAKLAELQTLSLKMQGADVNIGSALERLLEECGLERVTASVIKHDNTVTPLRDDLEVLRLDLAHVLPVGEIDDALSRAKQAARSPGAVWHVPVHYACGQVPPVSH